MKRSIFLLIILVILVIIYSGFLANLGKNNGNFKFNEMDKKNIYQFYNILSSSERKVYSQNGEDGVIEAIFEYLALNDSNRFYVEIGAGTSDARECNSRYLREIKGWKGMMFDGRFENASIPLHKAYILANNVVELFASRNVPFDLDFLSEDTDYADYWIIEAILTKYNPKVIVHEINQQRPGRCVTVPKENDLRIFDGTEFHGASVCAFKCLAEKFKYSLVYCESVSINCFWIRNDLIAKALKIDVKVLQETLTTDFLWKKPTWAYKKTERKWHTIKC
jgi:hypothetical protein